MKATDRRILINGGGIAGLSLAVLLASRGWRVIVTECAARVRLDGFMMDFFGLGWDVAERMGLLADLESFHYPIDDLSFIGPSGRPYAVMPIERVRSAVGGRYTYVRRSDLELVLHHAAVSGGAELRFGSSVDRVTECPGGVVATLRDGTQEHVTCVVGADGVHSRIRASVFGDSPFQRRQLDIGVVAYQAPRRSEVGTSVTIWEERGRTAMFYPIDASGMDAVFAARLDGRTADPREDPREFLERTFAGSGWICPGVIADIHRAGSVYSDALMQIRLPTWHQGRTVLLGDACDCPSLIAGQGSHLAMAGAWLLAEALSRTPGDPSVAFMRYEAALHPYVKEVQRRAAAMTRSWLPGTRSRLRLRRFAIRLALQPAFLPIAMRQFRAVPLAHLESRLM